MEAVGLEWPELDRSSLVSEVSASLRAGRSVLLSGGAGVGKTTVLRQAAPADSVWVQGLEGLSSVSLASLSILDVRPALDSVARAYAWVRGLAESGTVLLVDDVQWLDRVSSGIVAQAVQRDGLRVVLTVRDGHILGEDLARVLTRELCDQVGVLAFDRSMVEFALELALGSEPEASLVDVFVDRSGGNPLFLRELTLEAWASGRFEQRGPSRQWQLVGEPRLSSSLSHLLDARLARLDGLVREAVELVMVAEHLDGAAAAELVSPEAVARAVEQCWLAEDAEGQLWPGHPVLADAVRESLGSLGRGRVVMRLLDDTAPGVLGLSSRLRWALELDRPVSESELDEGYGEAVLSFDLDLAGRLAGFAYENYPSVARGLRVANDLHRRGEHADACALVLSLRSLADTPAERALVASHLVRTQAPIGEMMGTYAGARDEARDAARWADEALEGEPFAAMVAVHDRLSGETGGAEPALARYLDHPDLTVRHDVHELPMIDAMDAELLESALEHASWLTESTEPYFMDRPVEESALSVTCYVVSCLGDLNRALELTRAHIERVSRSPTQLVRAEAAVAHAGVCADAGLVEEGLDAITLARSCYSHAGGLPSALPFWEAQLLDFAGRHSEAEACLAETDRLLAADSRSALHRYAVHAERGLQTALVNREAGVQVLLELTSELLGVDAANPEMFALKNLVRLGAAEADHVARLAELAGTENRFFARVAEAGRARLDCDAAGLVELADDFASTGHNIEGLECLAAAIDLYQHEGDQSSARQLAELHRARLADCPGLQWPPASVAVKAPDLTRRERQVAELAALGWSNREVAGELSLSVRTVENNLQRAYAKLGINRRAALAPALGLQAV